MSGPVTRALMITPTLPMSGGNGLQQRCAMFLAALERVAEVEVLVIPAFGPVADLVRPADWAPSTRLSGIPADAAPDTLFQLIGRMQDPAARLEAFRAYGKSSFEARLSPATVDAACDLLTGRHFDLIHVARGYSASFALSLVERMDAAPVLTLDMDEDDATAHRAWADALDRAGTHDLAAWCRAEADALNRSATLTLPMFGRVFCASTVEAEQIRQDHGTQARVMENAVPVGPLQAPRIADPAEPNLLFVGALDHPPNAEGMAWFLRDVVPHLPGKRDWRIDIVGRGASADLCDAADGVGAVVHGWVQDLDSFYAQADIAIVPLRFGGGTKLKVLEAAARGTRIVSTSAGLAGLALQDGVHAWVGDGAAAFADAIAAALTDPADCAEAAHAHIRTHHDRANLVNSLVQEFSALVS